MTRALARFTVKHQRIRLKVRLLPDVAAVDAEYREGRRSRNGKRTHAFFIAAADTAQHVGTLVFPAVGRLRELVPHEVFHAVMQCYGYAHTSSDEPLANAVGILSARVFDALERRGVTI